MGYIHCCGKLHKSRSFVLSPTDKFIVRRLDYLEKCSQCGNTIIQIGTMNKEKFVQVKRFTKLKAVKYWEKLKSEIVYEKKYFDYSGQKKGKFYLNQNEYGVKHSDIGISKVFKK